MKKPDKRRIVQVLLGIVFLSASIYRLLNPASGMAEMAKFGLPGALLAILIAFELLIGGALLFDIRRRVIILSTMVFLGVAILFVVVSKASVLASLTPELFVFDPTPTDVVLHVAYVVLLWLLLDEGEGKNKQK